MSSETEAIAALRRGDGQGLETLVRLHQVRALRIACGITWQREAAEDVVADAFVKVYRRIGQLDPGRPFLPWFTRIVVNEALHAVRRRPRAGDAAEAEARLERLVASDPGPEAAAESGELRRLLLAAIARLEPRERAVIVLRYYADLDERGVAEALGWPLNTVKTRLHRGRRHLRVRLERSPAGLHAYLPASLQEDQS